LVLVESQAVNVIPFEFAQARGYTLQQFIHRQPQFGVKIEQGNKCSPFVGSFPGDGILVSAKRLLYRI
jgi:hypothetical protein